jgi:hypothetical protein
MGMINIVRFEEAMSKAEENKTRRALEPESKIEQLRHRIWSFDFHDSDSVRIRFLSEMLYLIYLHILAVHRDNL